MKYFNLLFFLLFFSSIGIAQEAYITRVVIENEYRAGAFKYGEEVNIEFDYDIDEPGGALIYARPFTDGVLSTGYVASGSINYSGSGTSTSAFFRINSTTTHVDEVRFQVYSPDQSEIYQEFFVPVDFVFGESSIQVTGADADQEFGSFLKGEFSSFDFAYDLSSIESAKFWAIPYYQGTRAIGLNVVATPELTGIGSTSCHLYLNNSILYEYAEIDSIKVILFLTNSDSTYLSSFWIPFNWQWGLASIKNVSSTGGTWPTNGTESTITYDYEIAPGYSMLSFVRPFTNGSLTPSYAASGGATLSGSGTTTSTFTITDGNHWVDHLRFELTNSAQDETYLEHFVPVTHVFGDLLIDQIKLSPPSPARMEADYRVNLFHSIANDQEIDARVFVSPYFNGSSASGFGTSGSPLYPSFTYSQEADDFFLSLQPENEVDQIQFRATDDSQANILAEYFIPARYTFKSSNSLACEEGSIVFSAPVDLTKSFQPVPFPNGNRDRVQLKWYKSSPSVRFNAEDNAGCDIEFWPIRDLATNTPIVGAPSDFINDVTKPGQDLFKWPVKFRANGANNNKRVEPNTRYNWRIRCACGEGSGTESPWSETKIFNTPDFDPITGIYNPPPGMEWDGDQLVRNLLDASQSQLDVTLFPNPVNQVLNLDLTEAAETIEYIRIIDMTGKVVYERAMNDNTKSLYQIEMTAHAPGLYLLEMRTPYGIDTKRFEKR